MSCQQSFNGDYTTEGSDSRMLSDMQKISKHRREKENMARMGETGKENGSESPDRIENMDLDETLPPCRECERHFFAKNSTFNVLDAAVVLVSMITFAADIVTDGLASSQYFVQGEPGWGCLTLAFILAPSIVMQVFSVRWYLADEDMTGWRWVFHCCLLGPVERYITVFETGLEARRSKDPIDFERLYHQQSDVCMLRLFESFLESAPQVVLQLYIMVATNDENLFTGISGIVSLVSLCWAVVAYSRAHRRVRTDKKGVSWPGVVLQTIWRIGMISSRVVALVLFASAFRAYTFLVAGIHWLAMVLWVYFQQTDFCDTWLEERLFNCVIGTIYVFCFFNLKEGNTRYRITIFYVVIAVENVVLLLLWHRFGMLEDWYTSLGFTVVFGGFIVGVATMILYYRFFHPRGAISWCGKVKNAQNDVCLHGKSNRLSTLGRKSNFDAEIFPRSRTPSPRKSQVDLRVSSNVKDPCSNRAATPCEHSPLKTDSFDWQTAPPPRSKSLGCLLSCENECESAPLKGLARSLQFLGAADQLAKPVQPRSQNSPEPCTCSFQMYELSGFATDLVDRFDKRKEMALAQSLLAEDSRLSVYSARSFATKNKTPCRACLDFEIKQASRMKSSHYRGRSYSQPNTPSVAKHPRAAHVEIFKNPGTAVRIASSKKAPNMSVCQMAAIPREENETLEISQVSADLPQMPSYIDSPEAPDVMNAYQVQKIYDQILEREAVPRISKRQLKFSSDVDDGEAKVISNHKSDIHKANKKLQEVIDEQKGLGNKDPIDEGQGIARCENYQDSTAHSADKLEPNPHKTALQNISVTSRHIESEPLPVQSEREKPNFDCMRSENNRAESPSSVHSEGVQPSNTNPMAPLVLERGKATLSTEIPQDKSTQPESLIEVTKKVCTKALNLPRSVLPKTRQVKDTLISAPKQSVQRRVCASDLTRQKPESCLRVAKTSHNVQDARVAHDSLNTSGEVHFLPSDYTIKSQSLSPVIPLEVLEDKNQVGQFNRVKENESGFRIEIKENTNPTQSPKYAKPSLDVEEPNDSQMNTLTHSKDKSAQVSTNEKINKESKKNSHSVENAQSTKVLQHSENRTPQGSPLSSMNACHSPGSNRSKPRHDDAQPGNLKTTPSVPSESSSRVTVGPGKENKPLTPLSARLALLSPSPNSSSAHKKPPRKSLGRIPTNLVADNVALFDK